MPGFSPVERYLHELHERFRGLDRGALAHYIPELSRTDPRWFGICVATVDGRVMEVGDTRQPFTIQSISKPFVYGLALGDRGKAAVLQKVGVEATGDAAEGPPGAPGLRPPRARGAKGRARRRALRAGAGRAQRARRRRERPPAPARHPLPGHGLRRAVPGRARPAERLRPRRPPLHPSTCWALCRAGFRRLSGAAPEVAAKLLQNRLASTARIVERLSLEVLGDGA